MIRSLTKVTDTTDRWTPVEHDVYTRTLHSIYNHPMGSNWPNKNLSAPPYSSHERSRFEFERIQSCSKCFANTALLSFRGLWNTCNLIGPPLRSKTLVTHGWSMSWKKLGEECSIDSEVNHNDLGNQRIRPGNLDWHDAKYQKSLVPNSKFVVLDSSLNRGPLDTHNANGDD